MDTNIRLAILYQAQLPPKKEGVQKPMKPGGYSDSGADIAFELNNLVSVITPVSHPSVNNDYDWVFPDTEAGIAKAIKSGANTFWLNTVLFENHPIENYKNSNLSWVGQEPATVDLYDDKLYTNNILKSKGMPIPDSVVLQKDNYKSLLSQLNFPLVIKPLRGRGSQGVSLQDDPVQLARELETLFSKNTYGDSVYAETYLSGEEITITVMPAGNYYTHQKEEYFDRPWCLPAVKRFNHHNGIAPYNGTVAVVNNSQVMSDKELNSSAITTISENCIKAAELVKIKAPIRIDCRANEQGDYFMFDLNMKPNMTGPSRSHRKDQDSLSLMAAGKIGWNYADLLKNMLRQKWQF